MTRTIRVLPDRVANQIAAGEVVERPASVVKELLENALDAGAGAVEIRVEQGGRRSIRVADDGAGMGREDAILSLDRHATSKIQDADDLRGVGTFGFRGEALPSIASVSRMTLETRHETDEVGTRISVRGGTIQSVEDMARTPGTTVTVESLFFNAPVRARFLRAASAETRAITDAVAPLALAHPSVRIDVLSEDRTLMELPAASDVVGRIAALWGEEAVGQLLSVEGADGDLRVRGVVQRPDAARPGFRRAYLFAGDRPFREAALLKAVDRGYRTTIPEGHRPWLFLFLDVPKGGVDVNVHPTKAEVRFRDLGSVEKLIESSVRSALEGPESSATFDRHPAPPRWTVREPPTGPQEAPDAPQMALFLSGRSADSEVPPGSDHYEDGASHEGAPAAGVDAFPEGGHASESGEGAVRSPRLWQVHRSWIMAEVRDGLLLIDQHAAHERILFERIMRRLEERGAEGQRLLFPVTVRLTAAEYALVQDVEGMLKRTGFEVEGFGGDTVIIHAVPDPHPYFDAERCFREMVAELTQGSELTRSARNQHERVAMSFACKAAIKAGQSLDEREIHELFDQLFATELPYHDVHGRPTTVRLSRNELDRKFGR